MATDTELIAARSVKRGDYVMIHDRFCIAATVSKPKHADGHSMVSLLGSDIETEQAHLQIYEPDEMIQRPIVTKTDYLVCRHIEEENVEPFPKCLFGSITMEQTSAGTLACICTLSIDGKLHKDIKILSSKIGSKIVRTIGDDKGLLITIMNFRGIMYISDV